jgi:AAA+ ATPase superfamily predicted ATPase
MSFMEYQVLGYKSPLYGRRTAQLKLLPFDYRDAAKFVPSYNDTDKALVYGVTGGIPKYLASFDDKKPFKENIIENYLSPEGLLYEEPSSLLKQEMREPQRYNRILDIISGGASRMNDIATGTGMETSAVSNYLDALISLHIVLRETPFGIKPGSRKTIYRLNDSMFQFWYRYVQRNQALIVTASPEEVYSRVVENDLERFMGNIFERMAADYVWFCAKQKTLPFALHDIGRWWGPNPALKREEEIDLVGDNLDEDTALFCECKFQNKLADSAVLKELEGKSLLLPKYKRKYYMLFAKKGFDKRLQDEAAKRDDVRLVTLAEMYW